MSSVSVVADTTGYLPRELVERHRITLVPLYCSFGNGEAIRESDFDNFGSFYDRLEASPTLPTTSPPRLEDFLAAYEPLLTDDRRIVSIHISSGISDTCAVARRAAEELLGAEYEKRIRVLDSAGTGAKLGLLAVIASRAAASGAAIDAVAELVREARMEIRFWFVLETLEFLKRGGRIGGATAWIGSTLKIKPILKVESEIEAVERVRTRERGLERLVEFGRQLHAGGADGWVVQHGRALEDAEAMAERLQEIFWRPPLFVSEIGPVVGTHTGPGVVGIGGVPLRFLE